MERSNVILFWLCSLFSCSCEVNLFQNAIIQSYYFIVFKSTDNKRHPILFMSFSSLNIKIVLTENFEDLCGCTKGIFSEQKRGLNFFFSHIFHFLFFIFFLLCSFQSICWTDKDEVCQKGDLPLTTHSLNLSETFSKRKI